MEGTPSQEFSVGTMREAEHGVITGKILGTLPLCPACAAGPDGPQPYVQPGDPKTLPVGL